MNLKGVLPLSVGYVKSLCGCCDGNDEEKISFAKYERFDDDDQEMQVASEWEMLDEKSSDAKETNLEPGNTITEWQAGWNVTNAIQVFLKSTNSN
jgi:hypothetical protein